MSGKKTVFVREATGLIKNYGIADLFFMNFAWSGGLEQIVFTLTFAPLYGGEPISATLLMLPGAFCIVYVYYLFTVAMPRSGGDYVFMSRALSPELGFALSFAGIGWTFWFWIGNTGAIFTSSGLAPALSVYSVVTGQAWASAAASFLTVPSNVLAIGVLAIVGFGLMLMYSNRLYMNIQNIFMALAAIGSLSLIALLATTNTDTFVSEINLFGIKAAGVSNLYQQYASVGASSAPPIYNLTNTLSLVPILIFLNVFVTGSNYVAGETRGVKRNAQISMFGSFFFILVSAVLMIALSYSKLGYNFLYGADSAYYGITPNPIPILPNFVLFVSLLANNPYVILFIAAGITASFLIVAPIAMIMMSRILFAYSFDRILPPSFASVNPRGNPARAIWIAVIGGLVFLVLFTLPSTAPYALSLISYGDVVIVGATFLGMCIAGIVFPYRKRTLFGQLEMKSRIAGIPSVTLAGIIGAAYILATMIPYVYDANFYVGASLAPGLWYTVLGVVCLFVLCMGWYRFMARRYKSGGMDLNKLFSEIPPE